MKRRLAVPLVGLAMSFALPTYAQQKDLADSQTTQKILALMKALNEAQNNNDPAAVAAFFTRDAVSVMTEGPMIGRQAIQKWYTDLYQWLHPKDHIDKLDGPVHLRCTASNELWATWEWRETGQDKTGEPIPIKGYSAYIYVREADDWKIRMCVWNFSEDTVLLVHKSLGNQMGAPQPAATPSRTASPGNQ